jgi:membrane fusion protein, multidrug efflux system
MRFLKRMLILILGPVVIAIGGGYFYMTGGRIITTENANIKADKIAVSTDVSGRVTTVVVKDNQFIAKGQLLFQIDEEPFRILRDKADANVALVAAEIDALRADYGQKQAEMKLAREDSNYFKREHERRVKLHAKGHLSLSKLDETRRDLATSRQKVIAIKQELARVRANLGGRPDTPLVKHPRYREAQAVLRESELNLRRTRIFAPTAGVVTNIGLQPGEYVQAGKPIFSIVETYGVWIQANLKETDLTYILPGHQATVRVDAYPNHEWTAMVSSISPATGAEFALLPPQNTSGNWVKVVQRIPIRLDVVQTTADPPLRAGMSVVVDIDTLHERKTPDFVLSLFKLFKGDGDE